MVLSIAIVHSRDMKFNNILFVTCLLFKKNLCEIVRDKKPLSKTKLGNGLQNCHIFCSKLLGKNFLVNTFACIVRSITSFSNF